MQEYQMAKKNTPADTVTAQRDDHVAHLACVINYC